MKKKNLLFGSLALLVVSIVAFTGATYAWFVAGRAPNVGEMDVQVAEASVVKIATKQPGPGATPWAAWSSGLSEFKLTVPAAELSTSEKYHNPNEAATPSPLNPVTPVVSGAGPVKPITQTNGKISFQNEPTFDGSTYTAGAANNVDYISYDLWFINVSSAAANLQQVYLDIESAGATDPATMFSVKGAYGSVNTTEQQKEIVKSLRVAFITYGTDNADASAAIKYVYEPYDAATLTSADYEDMGVQAPIEYATIGQSEVTDQESELKLFDIPSATAGGTLVAANLRRLTVVIWIEGNDLECVSGVSGGFFTSLIQFGVKDITP